MIYNIKNNNREELVMSDPILSVIVPIYNKEEYLLESLNSLINQTFTNSEIICVNDGSTDSSLSILKEIQKSCDRIKIISQSNKGASAARNEGIRNAKGKYIIMMDADDTIEKTMHETMILKAEQFNADMIICNFVVHSNAKKITHKLDYPYDVLIEREYIEREVIPNSICALNLEKTIYVHCTVLFKTEIFFKNEIKYDESHSKEEDKPVIMNYMKYAQRMIFIEEAFYHYIHRKGSLVTTYSDRFNNILDNIYQYKKWFSDIYDFDSENWHNYYIVKFEECIQYVLAHRKDVDNVKKAVMEIIEHPESIKTFFAIRNGYDLIKRMYEKNDYKAIYRYYMRKFLKFRTKLFIKNIIGIVK